MCRILGIVADEPADFRFCLRDAPRSLGFLSREHPDGWGVAVYDDATGWAVGKQPLSAFSDPRFAEVAGESHGEVLVAHVRRRTVGPVSAENTHPFQRGRWIFAHNGTIAEVDRLREATSPERLAEVTGTTDSEIFFAYLLAQFDAAGVAGTPENPGAHGVPLDLVLSRAVHAMASRSTFGACNFLLADGETLYAFRQGRTLHLLERSSAHEAQTVVPSPETGTRLEAAWTPRQRAILVASEQITDEPWTVVAEGELLKITRRPHPHVSVVPRA